MTQQHPIAAPIFRCLPFRVSGIPICRESRPFAADSPIARFQENDSPGIPVVRPSAAHLETLPSPDNAKRR